MKVSFAVSTLFQQPGGVEAENVGALLVGEAQDVDFGELCATRAGGTRATPAFTPILGLYLVPKSDSLADRGSDQAVFEQIAENQDAYLNQDTRIGAADTYSAQNSDRAVTLSAGFANILQAGKYYLVIRTEGLNPAVSSFDMVMYLCGISFGAYRMELAEDSRAGA